MSAEINKVASLVVHQLFVALIAVASACHRHATHAYRRLRLRDIPRPNLKHPLNPSFVPDGPSSRRAFFEKGAAALATGAAIAASPAAANAYALPDLPYPFEALEPFIDTPTMK